MTWLHAVADEPTSLRRFDTLVLVDLLERVENLPEDACGALRISADGGARGAVFVYRRRICWVAALGLGHRFVELVVEQTNGAVPLDTVLAAVRRCTDQGLPLLAALQRLSGVDAATLQAVVARHSAECLSAISTWSCPVTRWHGFDEDCFSHDVAYRPAQVLSWVGAVGYERNRRLAIDAMQRVVPTGLFAAGFPWPQNAADQLPLAVMNAAKRGVRETIDMGRWGFGVLQLADALSDGAQQLTAVTPWGELIAALVGRNGFCVAVGESGSDLARLLGNHARLRASEHGVRDGMF